MDLSKKNTLLMVIFLLPGCFFDKKASYEDSKDSVPTKGQHFTDTDEAWAPPAKKINPEKQIKEFETLVLEKINTASDTVKQKIKGNFDGFRKHQKELLNKGLKNLESETASKIKSWEDSINVSIKTGMHTAAYGGAIYEAHESRQPVIDEIVDGVKTACQQILKKLHQGFLDSFKEQQSEDFKLWKSELKAITQVDADLLTKDLTNIKDESGGTYTVFEASEVIDGVYLKIWNGLLSSYEMYPNIETEWTLAYLNGFDGSARRYQEKVRTYLSEKRDDYLRNLKDLRRQASQRSNSRNSSYTYQQSSNQRPGNQQSENKRYNTSSTGPTKPTQTVKNNWGETISSRFRSAMKYSQLDQAISVETGVRFSDASYSLAQKYFIWKTFADAQTQHLVVSKVKDAQQGKKERPKEAQEWNSPLKYDVAKYVAKTTKALLGHLDVDWSQSERECPANQMVRDVFLNKLAAIGKNPKLRKRAESAAVWERAGLLQNHMIVRSLIRSKEDPDGSDLKRREPGADYTYRFIMEYFNAN